MRLVLYPDGGGRRLYYPLEEHPGRVAVCNYPGWYILGNNAAGTDYGVFSNDYPGEHAGVDTYLGSFLDTRTFHALHRIGTSGVNIVGQSNTRAHKNIIFNECELGYINPVVNFDIVPYTAAIVDSRAAPDTEIVSDGILLPDNHIVTGFQIAPNTTATIDDSAATNTRSGSDSQKVILTTGRWITKGYDIIDDCPFAQSYCATAFLFSCRESILVSH